MTGSMLASKGITRTGFTALSSASTFSGPISDDPKFRLLRGFVPESKTLFSNHVL